jgi:hypothetical protein
LNVHVDLLQKPSPSLSLFHPNQSKININVAVKKPNKHIHIIPNKVTSNNTPKNVNTNNNYNIDSTSNSIKVEEVINEHLHIFNEIEPVTFLHEDDNISNNIENYIPEIYHIADNSIYTDNNYAGVSNKSGIQTNIDINNDIISKVSIINKFPEPKKKSYNRKLKAQNKVFDGGAAGNFISRNIQDKPSTSSSSTSISDNLLISVDTLTSERNDDIKLRESLEFQLKELDALIG